MSHLIKIVHEIEMGLVDANLGSGLYKKRLAAKGRENAVDIEH